MNPLEPLRPPGEFITYMSNNVKSEATDVTEDTHRYYDMRNNKLKVESSGATQPAWSKATEVTEATLTFYNIENDKMKVEPAGAT